MEVQSYTQRTGIILLDKYFAFPPYSALNTLASDSPYTDNSHSQK
jgi:hypothetical protein